MSYTNVKVNTSLVSKAYRNEFQDYLTSLKESKTIVWDEALIPTFDFFTNNSTIKQANVESMFNLSSDAILFCKTPHVIFIVRPIIAHMEKIATFIKRFKKDEKQQDKIERQFHILFVPRRTLLCEKKLKELEILTYIKSLNDLGLDIFPVDTDVLSMELPDSFKEIYLDQDPTCLFHIAKSLMLLQKLFGTIPNIVGKGDMADKVLDIMMRMKKEMEPWEPNVPPRIDNLIIIDRMVDPLTPLITQLTYEGLIDELFQIKKGAVELPADKFSSSPSGQVSAETSSNPFQQSQATDLKKIPLNSSDELFADVRDRNFNAVAGFLAKRLKLHRIERDERHEAKSVGDIKKFVSDKLPHIKAAAAALNIHLTIAGMVKEIISTDEFRQWIEEEQECLAEHEVDKNRIFIEEAIWKNEPLIKVLRLICIQSYCNDGLKQKVLDSYLREIVQNYGYQHTVTLNNLEKIGLVKVQGQTKSFQAISKALKLLVRGTNELKPEDISYTYSMYAPMSVRLAQIFYKPGWRDCREINEILPGKVRTESQQIASWLQKKIEFEDCNGPVGLDEKVTMVFFIGGVTMAEISAFRYLSHIEDRPAEYIIGTTSLINGNSWLESISETLQHRSMNPFL